MWKCEIIALAACAAMLQPGCNREKAVTYAATTQPAPEQAGLFTVSREQLGRLSISTPRRANWSITVHTTGTVDWDADHTTQVITQVSGPISRILVDTGAMVRGGDALLYVSSPDVSAAIAAYKKARNQRDLARRSLDRNKELLDRGAIAEKDLEAVQAAYNDTATDVQNSLQALRIFGISKQDLDQAEQQGASINPELPVRSPIAGTVVQKLISPGQLVQAGQTTCFLVSDVSTVWVQGHIFDRDLPSVRVGDLVDEFNASIPQPFHGVVSYIGAMVDAPTRTTPVRIVTPNPRGLLKKDTFVEAVIHTRTKKNILVVPVSAVMRTTENEPFVYVEVQPGQFARRLITTGEQQNGKVEVLSGLEDDEKIVAEGSLFLQFAESNR
ncbi:MAG: efflux RND transporter periplasmic adaptor subunit [Bryobacterales bacterium]|nr:efflux RND transporter periplasmic adaptor subunit [Bryobacterales bacterium]